MRGLTRFRTATPEVGAVSAIASDPSMWFRPDFRPMFLASPGALTPTIALREECGRGDLLG
jgi:hypothetical protein